MIGIYSQASPTGKAFQVDTGGTLLTSLVSYWKEEDSTDYYGSNNLTGTNTSFSSGKVNNGVVLGGTAYQSGGNILDQDGSGAFSIALWVKFNSVGVAQMIYGKQLASGSFGGYMLWGRFQTGPNRFSIDMSLVSNDSTFGIIEVVSPDNELSTGTWYHIIATYDGSKTSAGTKLYINNVDKGTSISDTMGTKSTSTSANFNIGSRNNGNLPVNGMIDEVGFWTKVLSSQERTDLYNSGNGQTMV